MGTPLERLKRAPKCYTRPLPELRASWDHVVFFKVPPIDRYEGLLKPFPVTYEDCWDNDHVYMPCSRQSLMPDISANGGTISRWEMIKSALESQIYDSYSLERAILSYNMHHKRKWNFDVLQKLFEETSTAYRDKFFSETLPRMQKLALRLRELCTQRIPILTKYKNRKLTFSQEQIACLLANAFFCTFPKRNAEIKDSPLPDINFSNLYSASHTRRKIEKLKCIINYFERVTTAMPTGTVSYTRQCLGSHERIDWSRQTLEICQLHVSTTGTIEDDGEGMLQADFANKYVGGDVLDHGLEEEEIRSLLCPEMIVSRLFTEMLEDEEVLIMTGCERFSDYTGYGDSFKFKSDYIDTTERDAWGRKYTEVVAMDALVIRQYKSQFEKSQVDRELTKAYCAFKGNDFKTDLPAVRTGNWGCGAFGGDKQLKALIQLMAASRAGRDVCYFTFGDQKLCRELAAVHSILKNMGLKNEETYDLIQNYHSKVLKSHGFNGKKQSLFQFIATILGCDCEDSTDECRGNSDDDFNTSESFDYKANTP